MTRRRIAVKVIIASKKKKEAKMLKMMGRKVMRSGKVMRRRKMMRKVMRRKVMRRKVMRRKKRKTIRTMKATRTMMAKFPWL